MVVQIQMVKNKDYDMYSVIIKCRNFFRVQRKDLAPHASTAILHVVKIYVYLVTTYKHAATGAQNMREILVVTCI